MFKLFSKPSLPSVEQWANRNAKRATPDDLIAGVIAASFAKDYKHWKLEGSFNQKHSYSADFVKTTLSRKMSNKKHIEILFVFNKTVGNHYCFHVIGCEVNGVRMTNEAHVMIYKNWHDISASVQHAEKVAAEAKAAMEANETKWNLAEALLGMKRDGLGVLQPVKTVEGEA
jgi:hypothetical protein